MGRAFADRLDGKAHARRPALAQRLAGLHGAVNDGLGVDNGAAVSQLRASGQAGLKPWPITEQNEAQARMPLARQLRAVENDARGMVAAHGV